MDHGFTTCRDVQAKIEAEAQKKADIKNKAKAMATALQTIGVIKVAKKVRPVLWQVVLLKICSVKDHTPPCM